VDKAAAEYAAAARTVSLQINGHDITVPEGTSILTAATQLGIHVSMPDRRWAELAASG
jgi:hypothetical protein